MISVQVACPTCGIIMFTGLQVGNTDIAFSDREKTVIRQHFTLHGG